MAVGKRRSRPWQTLLIVGLACHLAGGQAWARGGLTWNPRGYNIFSFYPYASVWGALMGAGIPHHSLDAPDFRIGGSSGNPTGPYGNFTGLTSNPGNPMMRQTLEPLPMPSTPAVAFHAPVPPTAVYTLDPNRAAVETPRNEQPVYHHNYNGYWLNGYWGGGLWGWGRWEGELGMWSFPRWWMGYFYYASGYGLYSNPFWPVAGGSPGPAFLDYSRPVQMDEPAPGPVPTALVDRSRNQVLRSPVEQAGLRAFDQAVAAFKEKKYDDALSGINEALKQLPRDPALHQFRALVLFARGEYAPAAATIYSVLSVSPGWNWTTQSGLYGNNGDFTQHLRALEAFCKQNLDAVDARFLLAYHYVTCGHFDAAVKQFEIVGRRLPADALSPALADLVSGAVEPEPGADRPASPPAAEPVEVDTAKIIGDWKASRSGGAAIALTIRADKTFVWTASRGNSSVRIEGTFYIEKDMLIMEGQGGIPLVGFVVLRDRNAFNFKVVGADDSDLGLDFAK